MGSSFKKEIFEEHVQAGLVGWAREAKKKTTGLRRATNTNTTTTTSTSTSAGGVVELESRETQNLAAQGEREIVPATAGSLH